MSRRRTHGFTLIELLAVLVIASVLIGLTIPAVTKLMSSSGVSAASREVANMLGLARQVAVTQRTYARVVFPYSQTGSHPEMWYRAYAVMTNRDNSASPATPWVYATKWEYLPVGAVFLDVAHSPTPTPKGALDDTTSLNDSLSISPGPLPFPDSRAGDVGQLAYIEFGPTGAGTAVPPNSATPSILAITEGFTTVASGIATPTPTASKTNNTYLANLTTISVDTLVGRIQVTR
jgi:prepilin-type N-terminal cleavage/methylation domain-containing protein